MRKKEGKMGECEKRRWWGGGQGREKKRGITERREIIPFPS